MALAYRWQGIGRVIALESVHVRVEAVPIAAFLRRTSSGVTPYPGSIILARREDFQRRTEADASAKSRMGDFAVDRLGDPFASGEIIKIAMRVLLG